MQHAYLRHADIVLCEDHCKRFLVLRTSHISCAYNLPCQDGHSSGAHTLSLKAQHVSLPFADRCSQSKWVYGIAEECSRHCSMREFKQTSSARNGWQVKSWMPELQGSSKCSMSTRHPGCCHPFRGPINLIIVFCAAQKTLPVFWHCHRAPQQCLSQRERVHVPQPGATAAAWWCWPLPVPAWGIFWPLTLLCACELPHSPVHPRLHLQGFHLYPLLAR